MGFAVAALRRLPRTTISSRNAIGGEPSCVALTLSLLA
jgi:hypothetical protein